MSEAEEWALMSFVIQRTDCEQDEFRIEAIYPDRGPAGWTVLPVHGEQAQGSEHFFVFQATHEDGRSLMDIECTVKMWDGRYRLYELWIDDENHVPVAEALTDSEDVWVHVTEIARDQTFSDVKVQRNAPTDYNAAGGATLDLRRHKSMLSAGALAGMHSYHTHFDERMEWREIKQPRYEYTSSNRTIASTARTATDQYAIDIETRYETTGHLRREYVDRAHADEIMKD